VLPQRRGCHTATHLPILVRGVKGVQETVEGLLLCPLSTPNLGVGMATVHPTEVIHSHHTIPTAVQLCEGS
jgi:hypothetical protein